MNEIASSDSRHLYTFFFLKSLKVREGVDDKKWLVLVNDRTCSVHSRHNSLLVASVF